MVSYSFLGEKQKLEELLEETVSRLGKGFGWKKRRSEGITSFLQCQYYDFYRTRWIPTFKERLMGIGLEVSRQEEGIRIVLISMGDQIYNKERRVVARALKENYEKVDLWTEVLLQ